MSTLISTAYLVPFLRRLRRFLLPSFPRRGRGRFFGSSQPPSIPPEYRGEEKKHNLSGSGTSSKNLAVRYERLGKPRRVSKASRPSTYRHHPRRVWDRGALRSDGASESWASCHRAGSRQGLLPIVYALDSEKLRFSQLRSNWKDSSPRAAAMAPKELQQASVIQHLVADDCPPANYYELTTKGRRLATSMQS